MAELDPGHIGQPAPGDGRPGLGQRRPAQHGCNGHKDHNAHMPAHGSDLCRSGNHAGGIDPAAPGQPEQGDCGLHQRPQYGLGGLACGLGSVPLGVDP